MKLSWTPDPEHPSIERLTITWYGLNYIIEGYTMHSTDDAGKAAAERDYIKRMQEVRA